MLVLKLGGAALKSTLSEPALFEVLARVTEPLIVVHGGGPEINSLAQKLGLEPKFHEGQRVTDSKHLEVVEQILSGKINPILVRGFLSRGRKAFGLSGVDGGLFSCELEDPALGLVGHVKKVEVSILSNLMRDGFIPVVSPVGLSKDFQALNVNADLAAAAIAAQMKADKLLFLTDRDGILDAQGSAIAELSRATLQNLMNDATVTGGMKVKARAILETLAGHPGCAVSVMNGTDWSTLESVLVSGLQKGTRVL